MIPWGDFYNAIQPWGLVKARDMKRHASSRISEIQHMATELDVGVT